MRHLGKDLERKTYWVTLNDDVSNTIAEPLKIFLTQDTSSKLLYEPKTDLQPNQ